MSDQAMWEQFEAEVADIDVHAVFGNNVAESITQLSESLGLPNMFEVMSERGATDREMSLFAMNTETISDDQFETMIQDAYGAARLRFRELVSMVNPDGTVDMVDNRCAEMLNALGFFISVETKKREMMASSAPLEELIETMIESIEIAAGLAATELIYAWSFEDLPNGKLAARHSLRVVATGQVLSW